MSLAIHVTSRHIELDDEITEYIQNRAVALTRIRSDLKRCHIVVDDPHQRRKRGRRYRVRVNLTLPEGVVIADRRSSASMESDNLRVAIAHAFRAAKRQLAAGPRQIKICSSRRKKRQAKQSRERWNNIHAEEVAASL